MKVEDFINVLINNSCNWDTAKEKFYEDKSSRTNSQDYAETILAEEGRPVCKEI